LQKKYIAAIDQGTTSTKVIIADHESKIVEQALRDIKQYYPQPGWVEHDAFDILESVMGCFKEIFSRNIVKPEEIAAIGITDQRETTILWDGKTGEPVYHAICWQSRQTAPICERMKKQDGLEELINEKTGLRIDPYFSASKIKFILENVPGVREKADAGEIMMGTVDSWLIWNLSGKKSHVIDYTNASRTLLLNIHTLEWDDELIGKIGIPKSILPQLKPSSCEALAMTDPGVFFGQEIPIAGDAGDQHAATIGQTCFEPGMAKNTYGTSLALFMNIGDKPLKSHYGLTTDLGWVINGKVQYAFEGVVFVGGAVVQWLRDGLGIIKESGECSSLAEKVGDTGNVYFVPAFTGMCAPYWDPYARGMLIGLTRGTTKEQICRAALESMGYQTRDVIEAMVADTGKALTSLRVDGGATKSEFLLQFQADILGIPVELPEVTSMAALGAAYLAGLGIGFWKNTSELKQYWKIAKTYYPVMTKEKRDELYEGWKKAVKRSLNWAEE